MKIISCKHCQVVEDNELIFGIGEPVLLSDLLSEFGEQSCPNCRASLNEDDIVFTDIDYDDYLLTEQVIRLAA